MVFCLAGSFGGWFIVARVVGRVSGCVGLRVCLSVVTVEGMRFGRRAVPVVRVPSALDYGEGWLSESDCDLHYSFDEFLPASGVRVHGLV